MFAMTKMPEATFEKLAPWKEHLMALYAGFVTLLNDRNQKYNLNYTKCPTTHVDKGIV